MAISKETLAPNCIRRPVHLHEITHLTSTSQPLSLHCLENKAYRAHMICISYEVSFYLMCSIIHLSNLFWSTMFSTVVIVDLSREWDNTLRVYTAQLKTLLYNLSPDGTDNRLLNRLRGTLRAFPGKSRMAQPKVFNTALSLAFISITVHWVLLLKAQICIDYFNLRGHRPSCEILYEMRGVNCKENLNSNGSLSRSVHCFRVSLDIWKWNSQSHVVTRTALCSCS